MNKKPVKHDYKLRMEIMRILDTDSEYAFYYRHFENETGATREEIKREMDWLREMGFVVHAKGLFNDMGEVAGSGFMKKDRHRMTYEEYLAHLEKNYSSDKG